MGVVRMSGGLIIVFTAASGTGKTTLARKLIEQDGMLKASVSYTTRERRSDEVDGESYHFVSSEQFSDMVDRGDFLERTSIYGNKYGTVKQEVDKIISQGKDVVLVLDWQGAAILKDKCSNVVSIFLLPPSLNLLEQRLENRSMGQEKNLSERKERANSELLHGVDFDYIVVNDNLDAALAELAAIVTAERLKAPRQINRHAHIAQMVTKD
tara:strand:+ start:4161 stop:4793 length:633 start_codon:yes stop_codon:yes gene_type:complete